METTISALQRPRRKHLAEAKIRSSKQISTAPCKPGPGRICHSCSKTDHLCASCKFHDAKCRCCSQKGHISTACHPRSSANAIVEKKREGSLHSSDTKVVLRISDAGDNLWHESCILFNKPIKFLIDTSSLITLVPSTHIIGLGAQVATNLDVDVRAYRGAKVLISRVIDKAGRTKSHWVSPGYQG